MGITGAPIANQDFAGGAQKMLILWLFTHIVMIILN